MSTCWIIIASWLFGFVRELASRVAAARKKSNVRAHNSCMAISDSSCVKRNFMNIASAHSWLFSKKNGTRLGGIGCTFVVCVVVAFLTGAGKTCVVLAMLHNDVSDTIGQACASSKALSGTMTTCGGTPGYTVSPKNASTLPCAGWLFMVLPSGTTILFRPCSTTTWLSCWRMAMTGNGCGCSPMIVMRVSIVAARSIKSAWWIAFMRTVSVAAGVLIPRTWHRCVNGPMLWLGVVGGGGRMMSSGSPSGCACGVIGMVVSAAVGSMFGM